MKKYILLLISLIPFLSMIYVDKYLQDIKKNNHCKNIDSELISFYHEHYISSLVVTIVSILGIIFVFDRYTKFLDYKIINNILSYISNHRKIINILSFLFTLGLFKLIYDLKKEKECENIDKNEAKIIIIVTSVGLILGSLNLLNIKLKDVLF